MLFVLRFFISETSPAFSSDIKIFALLNFTQIILDSNKLYFLERVFTIILFSDLMQQNVRFTALHQHSSIEHKHKTLYDVLFKKSSLLWVVMKQNKIRHSSRSSSIQRSKTTADQRCLVMFHNFGKFSFPSIENKNYKCT